MDPAAEGPGSGPGPPGGSPRDASSEGAPGTAGGSPEQDSPHAHSPSSQGGRSRSAAVSESHGTEADADAVAALLAATAAGLRVGAHFDWQARDDGSSRGPETASAAATTPGGGRRTIDVSQLPPIKDRVRWTPELHQLFVDAVEKLGGSLKAKPKEIMSLMKVPNLSLNHIKSHLQKHRSVEAAAKRQAELLTQQQLAQEHLAAGFADPLGMLGLAPQLAGGSYYSQDSLAQRASYDTLGMLPAAGPPSLTIASSNSLNVYQAPPARIVMGGGMQINPAPSSAWGADSPGRSVPLQGGYPAFAPPPSQQQQQPPGSQMNASQLPASIDGSGSYVSRQPGGSGFGGALRSGAAGEGQAVGLGGVPVVEQAVQVVQKLLQQAAQARQPAWQQQHHQQQQQQQQAAQVRPPAWQQQARAAQPGGARGAGLGGPGPESVHLHPPHSADHAPLGQLSPHLPAVQPQLPEQSPSELGVVDQLAQLLTRQRQQPQQQGAEVAKAAAATRQPSPARLPQGQAAEAELLATAVDLLANMQRAQQPAAQQAQREGPLERPSDMESGTPLAGEWGAWATAAQGQQQQQWQSPGRHHHEHRHPHHHRHHDARQAPLAGQKRQAQAEGGQGLSPHRARARADLDGMLLGGTAAQPSVAGQAQQQQAQQQWEQEEEEGLPMVARSPPPELPARPGITPPLGALGRPGPASVAQLVEELHSSAGLAERLVQWQMSIAEALREDVQSRRELHVKAEQQLGLSAASLLHMAQALRGHTALAQPPPVFQPLPAAALDAGGTALELAALQGGLAALRMLGLPVAPARAGGAAGGGMEPPKER